MRSNPQAPKPTMLPQRTLLQPALQHLGLQTIPQYLRFRLPGRCLLRQKRTDLSNPRFHNGLVHHLRHPERKSGRLTQRILHLDPEHLLYPLKLDQVRILRRQEPSLKPPGLAPKLPELLSLHQLTRKRLLKLLYVRLGKQTRRNSPPVEGHPLLVPDQRSPKLLRLLIKQRKLGT